MSDVITMGRSTLDEAETRAKQACEVALDAMLKSTIDEIPLAFEKGEQEAAIRHVRDLSVDGTFREKLESAYIAWLGRTHVIIPPKRSE